jgi:hypothetical protein
MVRDYTETLPFSAFRYEFSLRGGLFQAEGALRNRTCIQETVLIAG